MSDDKALGLDEAYSVKTPEDNRRLYAKWAATYESSFVENASNKSLALAEAIILMVAISYVIVGVGA